MAYCVTGNYTIQDKLLVGTESFTGVGGLGVCNGSFNGGANGLLTLIGGSESSIMLMSTNMGADTTKIGLDNSNGSLQFRVGSAERMRINCNGNIGIGTSSPGSILHIKGPSDSGCPFGAELRVWENSFGAVVQGSTIGTTYAFFGNFRYNFNNATGSDAPYSLSAGGMLVKDGIHIFTSSPNTSTFTPSERLTINNSGNVGIGTTSPSYRLQVCGDEGAIHLRTNSDGVGSNLHIRPNSGRCGWVSFTEDAIADRWGIGIKNGDSKLYFSSGNVASGGGTTRMVLDGSGNLGIGVTSPASNIRLQICDANAAGVDDMVRISQCLPGNHAWYRSERCGGATMLMGPTRNSADGCVPADSAIIWTTGNNPIVIGTCGRQRMRIANDGNVVVGGTSANIVGFTGTVLTVNGGGNYQGYEVSTSNVTRMTMVSDGNNGYLSTRVAGMCLIFEAGAASEKMRITSDGNVGIGCSAPSYRLHVNGTFYAAGSSIDYKEGICDYDTNSCLFMCLKPKTYQYKDEWKHLGKELKSETQIGLIAEEVAEVMPELAVLVNEDDNKVVRNVDYEKLSIVLLSELQKLRKEVDELKNNN